MTLIIMRVVQSCLLQSFFGRTYNNVANIAECKNGGRCVINKKNRTSCKDCRLRKCLSVGMSKSGSRYGRRSNWFKIHCLLQEQSNNQSISVAAGNTSSYAPNFLSGLVSQTRMQQDGVGYSKDGQTPSENLTHLIQAAMLRQEREMQRTPPSDDVFPDRPHTFFTLQKRKNYVRSSVRSPPLRRSTPSPFDKRRATATSPTFPMNIISTARGLSEREYVHVLQEVERAERYKRYADTVSESGSVADGSSDGDHRLHDVESRSNAELNYTKTSPALPEQEFSPSRKTINATLTLTAAYQRNLGQYNLGLVYPPPGLVTPATSQNSLAGGDLLLVSPSPGGLAVEQDEPIDLSVRTSKSSPPRKQSSEEKDPDEADEGKSTCSDSSSKEEEEATPATGNAPLDLTLTAKRFTEVL